jgi:hypothetical protein
MVAAGSKSMKFVAYPPIQFRVIIMFYILTLPDNVIK